MSKAALARTYLQRAAGATTQTTAPRAKRRVMVNVPARAAELCHLTR